MFPTLSKIQDDKVRVKHLYLSTISIIALITFPMMTGLLIVADSFVLALFGSKWADLIPILQVFCLLGMVQSIGTTVGWIYQSQGRTDWMFWWGIAAGSLLILSIIIGIMIGSILSVAVCYTIMSGVVLAYHNFAIPGKLINMTFSDVVRSVSGAFGCAVLMAGGVYLLRVILPSEWPHWANLLSQVPFGIIIYIVLIHFFKLKSCVEAKELFWEQWQTHFPRKNSIC
jgi:PST family polysaccharide transporter